MGKTRILILFGLALVVQPVWGQTLKEKAQALIDSSMANLFEPAKSMAFADSAYQIAIKNNLKREQALAAKLRGVAFYYQSAFDSSMVYYRESLDLNLELGDSLEIGKGYLNIATTYNAIANYEEAITYSLQAQEIFEKIGDRNGVGRSLNIVGHMYFFKEELDTALYYFRQHLANSEYVNDSVEIVTAWNNMGSTLSDLEQYDSALYYLESIVDFNTRMKVPNIGATYNGIGLIHDAQGNGDQARKFYDLAIEEYDILGDKVHKAETILNLGIVEMGLNRFSRAEQLILEARHLSEEVGNKHNAALALQKLSELKAAQGNYREAFRTQSEYIALNQEVFTEENQKNINEIQTRYETERKEKEIEIQRLQISEQQSTIERRTLITVFLIGLILALIIIAYMTFNRIKMMQAQSLREQEQRNQEKLFQFAIETVETERKRFSEDLHDGFGQFISVLRMNIDQARNHKNSSSEQLDLYNQNEEVLKEMSNELKNICFNLMPKTLVQHGLSAALEEFALRINQVGKVKVEVSFHGLEDRLPDLMEISLYRITQEWVNNSLKYADPSKIEVQVIGDDKEITLTIEDDGKGFDPAILDQGKGNGWKNISSRVNLIKGDLEVDSRSNVKGTTFILNAPMKKAGKVDEELMVQG